ncbi:MAG: hypothetical protein F8N39_19445 [Clostridiaceae bacterium]|nr:hypothetical protein [Clostridiaceae bacterium]
MILPIRVTEFTLIPKECLDYKKGSWHIKIRRTKMKGSTKKVVTYRIDEDYVIYEYAISNEVAEMIFDYKNLVKDYKESNIDSLFIDEVYVKTLNNTNDYGFFHVNHFSRTLDIFYCDVIEKYYNYEVIPKDKLKEISYDGEAYKLKDNEIVKISLGDSRHIAMQNMLLNGCNILMAKEITGHESINTIYHYSGNMKNLIKCRAYSLFEMSKKKVMVDQLVISENKNLTTVTDEISNFAEVDQGKCFSPFFTQGDMKDCYAVAGNCNVCKNLKENKNHIDLIKKQEIEVENRIERLKNWICSEKEYRNTDTYKILTSQLKACVENLQNVYVEEMKEGNM